MALSDILGLGRKRRVRRRVGGVRKRRVVRRGRGGPISGLLGMFGLGKRRRVVRRRKPTVGSLLMKALGRGASQGGRRRRVRRGRGIFSNIWSGIKSGVSSVGNVALPIVKGLAGDAIKGLVKSKLGLGRRRRVVRRRRVGGVRHRHAVHHRKVGAGIFSDILGTIGLGRKRRVRRRRGGSMMGSGVANVRPAMMGGRSRVLYRTKRLKRVPAFGGSSGYRRVGLFA